MSKEERHKKLQAHGWTYSSYWTYLPSNVPCFEVWIRGTQSALYFFEREVFKFPTDSGYEERHIDEIDDREDGTLSVMRRRRLHWKRLRSWYKDQDVVGFRYYSRPRVAVRREALAEHFDEAMKHVEQILEADEHPERRRIFAETDSHVFFGEPGNGGKLEELYGVQS